MNAINHEKDREEYIKGQLHSVSAGSVESAIETRKGDVE